MNVIEKFIEAELAKLFAEAIGAMSYSRFSSEKQLDNDSIRRQAANCNAWLATMPHIRLDAAWNFKDESVSAFSGKNAKEGELRTLLNMVDAGIIAVGTYLIIEDFDRLSRLTPYDAQQIFRQLIDAGIQLVTVLDADDFQVYNALTVRKDQKQLEKVYDAQKFAYTFSKKLSARILKLYEGRKLDGKIMMGLLPSWIFNPDAGKKDCCTTGILQINEAKKATVLRIIKMAIDDKLGASNIAKILNNDGTPIIATCGRHSLKWSVGSINCLIRNRALIGEFKSNGQVIENYYPAIIDMPTWNKLQLAVDARKKHTTAGRSGNNIPNLFGKLLVSGWDGGIMRLQQKHKYKTTIVSANSLNQKGEFISFPYSAFESSFLKWVSEIQIGQQQQNNATDFITQQIVEKKQQIKNLQSALNENPDLIGELLPVISNHKKQEKALQGQLEQEQRKQYKPTYTSKNLADLITEMEVAPEAERIIIRSKIKSAISTVCKKIEIFPHATGKHHDRMAFCMTHLADGNVRIFFIRSHNGKITTGNSQKYQFSKDNEYMRDLIGEWFRLEQKEAA